MSENGSQRMILAYGFRLQILMKLFNFESLTLCQALFFCPHRAPGLAPGAFFLSNLRGNLRPSEAIFGLTPRQSRGQSLGQFRDLWPGQSQASEISSIYFNFQYILRYIPDILGAAPFPFPSPSSQSKGGLSLGVDCGLGSGTCRRKSAEKSSKSWWDLTTSDVKKYYVISNFPSSLEPSGTDPTIQPLSLLEGKGPLPSICGMCVNIYAKSRTFPHIYLLFPPLPANPEPSAWPSPSPECLR